MIGRLRWIGILAFLTALTLGCTSGRLPPPVYRQVLVPPIPPPLAIPYLNPDLPLHARVDDLLGRMTLEEKVSQTLYDAPAIERLGIPEYNWWNEALHGVARAGLATVFPQAIGLAATFDTDLMFRVATAISDEARAKHHEALRRGQRGIYQGLTFWSPNINIFRDPRWGRGMETYGEDPYLAGRLAVEFVRGMQGDDPFYLKTIATPKHYAVHSGPEPDRHTFDAAVDERDLRETYLPAFRASVVEGRAESVMCSYNRFRGAPACASHELLQQILRDEWGFQGYVVSDCWAIMDIYANHRVVETAPEAAAISVAAGTDLNCGVTFDSLGVAVRDSLITEEQLDQSIRRLLAARFRLGMFDPPHRVPFVDIPFSVNDSDEHRALALEATRKSLVLLKNEDGVLPFGPDVRNIAVIGPNADDVEVLLGNYHGIPSAPVTPLQGIRMRAPGWTTVMYGRGSDLAENVPFFEVAPSSVLKAESGGRGATGLRGEYFSNDELSGEPVAARIDRTVDFAWFGAVPVEGFSPGDFSIRWSGSFVPPVSGAYSLGGRGLGWFQLFVDDSLAVDGGSLHEINTGWTELELEAGVAVDIRVEFRPARSDAVIRLVWSRPETDLQAQAVQAAEEADVVVMFLGLSPKLEREEDQLEVPGFHRGDRVEIGLPAPQRELMEAVVATGRPVVLVLLNGSALALPWAAEHVPAILEAWYPGQAAGTAIAEALFGDFSPAGRLPVTFYRSVDQIPPFDDYDMEGRTYKYFRGDPLFPFGHGLSYANFSYSNLVLPDSVEAEAEVQVSVDVRNWGSRPGEEVVQLYITDLEASVPVPIRSLQGIQRMFLEPGQERTVSFTLTPPQLSLIDSDGERVVEAGLFEVSIGGKQPGFSGLADAATTEVVTGRFQVVGRPTVDSDTTMTRLFSETRKDHERHPLCPRRDPSRPGARRP